MIRVDLQIEGEARVDSLDGFGLTYLESDHRLAAPLKEQDVTSYAEEPGEHRDERGVDAPFDFTVKFAALAEGGRTYITQGEERVDMRTANDIVAAFNDRIRTKDTDGLWHYKRITLYDHKHRKITGLAQPIGSEPEDFFICNGASVAILPMVIRVDRPQECDFNYYE